MADKLMAEDHMLAGEEYERYRKKLMSALVTAEFRERLVYRVCLVSGVVSFTLMFVGGSRIFCSFDPWDETANPISITLGATFTLASILFWVLLASYYSRLRPNTQRARDSLRDEQIQRLERSLAELKDSFEAMRRSQESRGSGEPNKNNSGAD